MNKKKESMPTYMRVFIKIIFVGVFIFAISLVFNKGLESSYDIVVSQSEKQNDPHIKEVKIKVNRGATTEDIAQAVYDGGLISNKLWFRLQSKLYKFDGKYKEGTFSLNTTMDEKAMMEALTTNQLADNAEIKVTIPEGFNIIQIAERLEKEGIVSKDDFLAAVNEKEYDYDFLQGTNPNKKNRLEGYLFPDTYFFPEGITSEAIIIRMLNRFEEITNNYSQRFADSQYSFDEIITIASIIEQEARLDEERPIISGVIYNRIDDSMNLQMCSTVQYTLEKKKANLSYDDLEVESPYNTYKYEGLPIGAICSPGEASIKAALYPEEHDYFFFVVKDPEEGSHAFSTTLGEHNSRKTEYKQTVDKNFVE
ncbi:MAG: endolytic transglycosylase MltG [Epulopiscium sp.]|nr:endolytic transglycosylase MltG [Candidatus Epulonipiscium sp.]